MALQTDKQVNQISPSIALQRFWFLPQEMGQRKQLLLKLKLTSKVHDELIEKRLYEHAYLALADIVFALRFHECVGEEEFWLCGDNLFTHVVHQLIADVFHNNRLEGKNGPSLAPFYQAAA